MKFNLKHLCLVCMLGSASVVIALPITLPGLSEFEGWSDMTSANHPGYPSFGNPTDAWPSPILPNDVGSAGNAAFDKVSGGGFPSGESIYNFMPAGTYSITNDSPLSNLETVVFQADIAGAFQGNAILNYNGGSQELLPDFQSITAGGFFSGMGGDSENHGFQWDLSSVATEISEFEIVWTTIAHNATYSLQLDSGDTFAQAIPEPETYAVIIGALMLVVTLLKRHQHRPREQ